MKFVIIAVLLSLVALSLPIYYQFATPAIVNADLNFQQGVTVLYLTPTVAFLTASAVTLSALKRRQTRG